jgi:hypothetical protein
MCVTDFIIPLGLTSFVLATVNVTLCLFTKRPPSRCRLLLHKICALALLGTIAGHGAILILIMVFAD